MIDTDTARRCNTAWDVSWDWDSMEDDGGLVGKGVWMCAQWRVSVGNVGGYRIGTGDAI